MKKYLLLFFILPLLASCEKSDNNFLKSLKISTGDLIPAFSKDTTQYSITSLNSLREIEIDIETQEKGAKILINGKENKSKIKLNVLKREEFISIKVIAPSGKAREYKIFTIPKDFPEMSVITKSNPTPGYIFLTNFYLNPAFQTNIGRYAFIIDNNGTPVYYKKIKLGAADFKMQPDGSFTYFNTTIFKMPEVFGEFIQLDKDFNQVKIYDTKHGYTDMHEFAALKNGNTIMLGVDMVEKDLTSIGGKSNAKTWDYFIEESSTSGKTVMEWKSWEHFKITDMISAYDLTIPYIEHGANCNSIFIDSDENIILSSRKLDEVTKINRKTGEIIWRMGGIRCKNNQFKFINDPLNGFSHQHSVSRLKNGNLLVLDNGNHNGKKTGIENIFFVPKTRIVEYKIDEIQKTAELVWEYKKEGIFIPIMGSCQRLENGNTFICWSKDNPCITEVDNQGNVVLEMALPTGFQCYSAYKFNFK